MGAAKRLTRLFCVLVLLRAAHAQKTNCSLLFHLDPDASLLSLSGSLEEFDGVLSSASPATGALGALQLQFSVSSAACPTTAELVLESLRTGSSEIQLRTVGSLEVYPSVLSLGFGARFIRVANVEVSLEGSTEASKEEGPFEMGVTVVTTSGPSWVGNIQLGDETIDLEGNASTRKGAIAVHPSIKGQALNLELAGVTADLGIISLALDDGSPDMVTGVVQLNGTMYAKSIIGCESDCGQNGHGKCGLNGRNETMCICECGWDGTNCDNPKGFCPTFSDMLVAESGTCLERQLFDPSTRECSGCVKGWEGTKCNSCSTNSSCNAFWDANNMECRMTPNYQDRTQLKVYSCDFSQSPFLSFVGPSVEIACNTSSTEYEDVPPTGGLEDVIDGPWCELSLRWSDVTPVRCIATQCEFGLNSTRGQCAKASCECDGGKCTGSADAIFGSGVKDISMVCLESEDSLPSCTLAFGSLAGIELKAPCFVSECYDPDAPLMAGLLMDDSDDGVDWKLLLLGCPLFLHAILAILVGACACQLNQRAFLASRARMFGTALKSMEQSLTLSEIKLENVSCSVPKRKTLEERKTEGGVLRKLSAMTNATDEAEPESLKNPLPQLKGLTHEVLQMLQPPRKGYASILQDVNCTFTTGELVAIMGPSGCGKSTFLSVLSGMSLFGSSQRLVTGRIMVNGKKRGSWIRKIVVFVPQEDNIMAMLTVRECLTYSAILRLPIGTKYDLICRRVQDSIMELGLESVADNQVGGSQGIRGVSGGERRRVTIGMEMVTRPTIILMDEPTSGLDSHTALNLMTLLKRISQHGRLIVVSVHQPSPVMFSKLDKILLLAHGFPVFQGHPQEIDTFFKRHGRPVPRGTHPAEHILSVVGRPESLVAVLNSIFTPSNRCGEESARPGVRRAMHSVILDGELSAQLSTEVVPKISRFAKTSHFLRRRLLDLKVTFWRGFVDIWRNPVLLWAHWLMSTIMGIGLGFIFFDVQRDFAGAQNRLGGFFFCLAFLAFTSSTTVDVLHVERTIVLREIKAGYYRVLMYMISKLVLDSLLLRCIPALLLGIPVYFLMGLQGELMKFLMFIFALCTFNMTVGAFSMSLAILITNSGTATLVINVAVLISLLFSSFPANASTVPTTLSWINHLSFIGYGLRILTVSELDGLTFEIQASEDLPAVTMDSSTILSVLGISNNLPKDISIMVGICFASMIMVIVSIWFQMKFEAIQKMVNRLVWRGKKEELPNKSEKVIRRPTSYYGINLAAHQTDGHQPHAIELA